MLRQWRGEYPGAIDHVMRRGPARKPVQAQRNFIPAFWRPDFSILFLLLCLFLFDVLGLDRFDLGAFLEFLG